MIPYLEQMLTWELRELAEQSKIPDAQTLPREDLLHNLEDDYWAALYDAICDHNELGNGNLFDLYY